MSPFGKIIFALIFSLLGFIGAFWGILIGHLVIDRSILNKFIKQRLNDLDYNIQLLLPYRFTGIYNKLLSPLDNKHFKNFTYSFDLFIDKNLVKIFFVLIGFSLHSNILIFSGIIIGFFCDNYRLDISWRNHLKLNFTYKFWRKANPFKLALSSKEAKQVIFIQSMAALCAKICRIDGKISEKEIRIFSETFNISKNENTHIANIFFEAQKQKEDYERHAYQLKLISKRNLSLQESIIEGLFKIAVADGGLNNEKKELLREISDIIGLPLGNFEAIQKSFDITSAPTTVQDYYKILDISFRASDNEIKRRWKRLSILYHPDRVQSKGGSVDEIRVASDKMAQINNAYHNIMKSRKIL